MSQKENHPQLKEARQLTQ